MELSFGSHRAPQSSLLAAQNLSHSGAIVTQHLMDQLMHLTYVRLVRDFGYLERSNCRHVNTAGYRGGVDSSGGL